MKQLSTLLFCCCLCLMTGVLFAQNTVTGTLVDNSSGEAIPGATVTLDGTDVGTITDLTGNFTLEDVSEGSHKLYLKFIGYEDLELDVEVDGDVALNEVSFKSASLGLDEVLIVSSAAVDRKTPVAVATIKADQIEERVGNQELPEVLKSTPSIYVTKQGGGFGDSRINVRGFDQRNVAVMINGIPVNDMENGWVYWSNWAGLSDVASRMEVQRGLGSSKLAVSSVGGSINIVTNAAEMKRGGTVSLGTGNDGYLKAGLSFSTGLSKSGWAFSAQGTRTQGNGYIDGTQFSAWSYFASLSKRFNDKHSISITGLGAPQWHHQRTVGSFDGITIATYREKGLKYNQLHGDYNGDEFSFRKNFYHKPKFFINHYWNISDKTNVKTSAYASIGRGGGTGPRGRINDADGNRYYDGSPDIRNADGTVRWDDLDSFHRGEYTDANWGQKEPTADGEFAGQYTTTSSGNGFIRRASMNEHNWYGVLSTLTTGLTDNLNLLVGVDGRYYKGLHYRRVEDLLGHDAYLSRANDNNPNNYITAE